LGYCGEQAFPKRTIGHEKIFPSVLIFNRLGWAISNFPGLATQGTYDSIVLDFREDLGAAEIAKEVNAIAQQYQVAPQLNSEFSAGDNVYVVKGDRTLLNALKNQIWLKIPNTLNRTTSTALSRFPTTPCIPSSGISAAST
jgi:hypothetical protein